MQTIRRQSPAVDKFDSDYKCLFGREDLVSSVQSSPERIQSHQKEVDELFDNFQQQMQVKYKNSGDEIQESDTQAQRCLTKIFENYDIKQQKQFSRQKIRSQQVLKKKYINLNQSKNTDNYKGIDAISTLQSPKSIQKYRQQELNAELTTNDFLETISNTATETDGSGGVQSQQRLCDNTNRIEETTANFPFICNGMSNLSQLSNRYKEISYNNETVPCQFNKGYIEQRNNCNSQDNILNIRNHKFERQRVLSNETHRSKSNNLIKNYKNIINNNTHNQSSDIVRHHYLNFISEKENQQQLRQQNFIQNLRNINQVEVENPNQNKYEDFSKNLQLGFDQYQNLTQKDLILKQSKPLKLFDIQNKNKLQQNDQKQKQNSFSQKNLIQKQNVYENKQENSISRKNDIKQVESIQNNNAKILNNKNRSLRSAWTGYMKNNINYRNENNFRIENNNILPNNITNNQTKKIISKSDQKSNQETQNEPIKLNLRTVKSHQTLKQVQQIQRQEEEKISQNTKEQKQKGSERNMLDNFNTQTTLDYDIQTDNKKIICYQSNETSFDGLKQNCEANKPQKKVVIKISKESVFSKIIEEQNEKQTLKREGYTQQILNSKIDRQTIPKQRSLEKKQEQNQNQHMQIYQDQSILQSYLIDTQSLQQRVKSFKFPKEINNVIETSKEKLQSINQSIIQDKENINENILNKLNITSLNNIDSIQQQPIKYQFKTNHSFHRNRSFYNEGQTPEIQKRTQNLLDTQKAKEFSLLKQQTMIGNQPYLIQNNIYCTDDIRNVIYSKRYTTPQIAGNTFFKNRLQSPQTEIQNSEKNEPQQMKHINGTTNMQGQVLKNLISAQSDEHLLLQNYSKQTSLHRDLKKLTLTSNNDIYQKQLNYQNNEESKNSQITSTESIQSIEQQNNTDIQQNINSNVVQFNNNCKSFELDKQNEKTFFNQAVNPNKLTNTKINFRLNRSIQHMIIQNIDEFQEKIVRN